MKSDMGIMSMTGRGTGTATGRRACVEVELSSVNRKQLDIQVGLPRRWGILESRVHRRIRQAVGRGRISGEIRIAGSDAPGSGSFRIHEPLARSRISALRKTAAALKLPDDLQASSLLVLPGVLSEETPLSDPEKLWPVVRRALDGALEGLCAMRRREGRALARDIRTRLKKLRTLTVAIGRRAPKVAPAWREALLRRLGEALPDTDWLKDERVLREVALFADRADITEEQVRLGSHLDQAGSLLDNGGEVGRKMEFLIQEMGREINTIGSKANDLALTRLVIEAKAELERIREQNQNME